MASLIIGLVFSVYRPVANAFRYAEADFSLTEATASNSQTMILLEPLTGTDPKTLIGGGEMTVVDGDALLPDSGPLGTMKDIKDIPPADQVSVYVVRAGDTLSQVAKMFQVSVNTIIWANDLARATAIREGQVLVILPINGIQHTVAKGETLQSIAKKYRGDLSEIAQYNDLNPVAPLAVGVVVIIPDGEETAVETKAGRPPKVIRGSGPSYQGYYLRPIAGGRRTQGLHGYNGVDLSAGVIGTPIIASAGGTVIVSKESGWNGGYGKYVVVKHSNGTQTLYAHNNDNIVAVGQTVVQGQVIGYLGSTGNSTGPHIHFEIRGAKNPF